MTVMSQGMVSKIAERLAFDLTKYLNADARDPESGLNWRAYVELQLAPLFEPPKYAAGQIYKWVGLAGQHDPERYIVIGSIAATMQINTYLFSKIENARTNPVTHLFAAPADHLSTIAASDFVTAVEQGWLVLVEED